MRITFYWLQNSSFRNYTDLIPITEFYMLRRPGTV